MSQFNNLDADTKAAMYESVQDERERLEIKRRELLEKFINGYYRYNNEHIFRSIIEALMRDADPLIIIDKLMEMNKDLQERIKEYLTHHSTPIKIEVKQ